MSGRAPLEASVSCLAILLALTACGGGSPSAESASATASAVTSQPTAPPSSPPTPLTPPTTAAAPTPSATESADPRWRFYTADRGRHTSPWFAGSHRVMIGYGCNPAPWYAHDSRCPGRQGFHHGIDIAMPCGTPLFSAVRGVVLDAAAAGSPGAAYGQNAFRIRSDGFDILIGHSLPPMVHPGDQVRPGQQIARASDRAAPDGCHLHFEVRRAGGGLSSVVDPARWLALT